MIRDFHRTFELRVGEIVPLVCEERIRLELLQGTARRWQEAQEITRMLTSAPFGDIGRDGERGPANLR
jgi:hypothetical protein